MEKIAWGIIRGLCAACGWGFFICLLCGKWDTKGIITLSATAAIIVIISLFIGLIFFKF